MFSFCKRKDEDASGNRVAEVGWILNTHQAGFIWDAPRKITRPTGKAHHAKALNYCPRRQRPRRAAVRGAVPHRPQYRLPLQGRAAADRQPLGRRIDHSRQASRADVRRRRAQGMARPNRPIIQVMTPYIFLADEPVWITQLPPYYYYPQVPWPGVLIGGVSPSTSGRAGWYGPSSGSTSASPITISRGEPWFYVSFETMDPLAPRPPRRGGDDTAIQGILRGAFRCHQLRQPHLLPLQDRAGSAARSNC